MKKKICSVFLCLVLVSSAERGDLVFYGEGPINHVAICAGNILKIVRVF